MKRLSWVILLALGCTETPSATPDAAVATDVTADVAVDARPPDPTPYMGPDDWCPGRDHCRGTGDNRLLVGVAKQDITPTITETWTDRDMDGAYDEGEPFVDANGNMEFDGVWIAGFGHNRPARGVHDRLEVRALAFRYNDITVAWAVIDCVGYFINEIDLIRADPSLQGMGIDKVIVSSTHVHEAVDTVGLWGRDFGTTGRVPAYMALVRQRTAAALRAAVMGARPVRMRVAQTVTVDAMGSTLDYVNDTRDPKLYDPTVTAVQFVDDAMPTRTVATWVNWAAHPEYTGSRNNELSADYVHWLRDTIENGLPDESIPGVGGMTVFVNGALGGQLGPGGGVHPRDRMGMPVSEAGFRKAELAGTNVARLTLQALQRDGMETREVALSYRTAPIHAAVENIGYGIFFNSGIFDRELFNFNTRLPLSAMNRAWVRSRVTYFQVGPVAVITAPGELHPELWVGYDSRWSWGQTTLREMPNAPDLSMAPRPPYLRDLMLMNPGVRYAFVGGLTEDFLGYIVPSLNYVLHSGLPYLAEAPGDHYEETNSIGPGCEQYLHRPMMELTRWRAPMQ
jgi:hypothetical protein